MSLQRDRLHPCCLPARIVLCAVLLAAGETSSPGDPNSAAATVPPYSSRRTAAAVHRDSPPPQPVRPAASPRPAGRATLGALRTAVNEPAYRPMPRRLPAVLPVEPFTSEGGLVPLPGNNIAIQADELGHADRFAPGTQGGDFVLTAGWSRAEPAALDQRDTANPLRSETLPEAEAPRRLPRANPLRASASASSRLN